jgi:predicted DsbA family dithiol-disulfide isomerase
VNSTEEVAKIAALAGMSRETFDKTIKDQALQRFILDEQAEGEKKYNVDSTPTFIINGKSYPGERSYDAFAKAVAAASS